MSHTKVLFTKSNLRSQYLIVSLLLRNVSSLIFYKYSYPGDPANNNTPTRASMAASDPVQAAPQNGNTANAQNGDPDKNPEQVNGNTEKETQQQNGGAGKKPEHEHKKLGAAKDKMTKQQKIHDKNNPPGGYDTTPIPSHHDGYTIRFTFHRAENLPMSDLHSRSSDPFIVAQLTSALPKRHKEDPDMMIRTPTKHKTTDPEWNTQWTVAGVPSSGFRLKCRIYDEDPSDHDDRLGNVTIHVNGIDPQWPGIRNDAFEIKKRMGSKRAYLIRGCAAMLSSNVHMSGLLYISAELLGKSDPPHGRVYTVGGTFWFKHYSPMIGRIAGTKAPGSSEGGKDGKTEKYE